MTLTTSVAPTVSVILPTHDRAPSLGAAIRSVLDQSFSDLELIVVNDASTDGTAGLLERIKDERLRVVDLPVRSGAPGARNTGIELARGRYVAFQDSDDLWRPDRLLAQVAALDAADNSVAVAYGRMIRNGRSGARTMPGGSSRTLSGDLVQSLAMDNFIALPTALVRTEHLRAVGGFHSTLPRFQDWDLWLMLASRFRFLFVDEIVLDSHETEGSITLDQDAYFEAIDTILVRHRDVFARVPGAALHHHLRLARKALFACRPRVLIREVRAVVTTIKYRSMMPVVRHNLALRAPGGR